MRRTKPRRADQGHSIAFRVKMPVWYQIEALAYERETSVSAVMRELVTAGLEAQRAGLTRATDTKGESDETS